MLDNLSSTIKPNSLTPISRLPKNDMDADEVIKKMSHALTKLARFLEAPLPMAASLTRFHLSDFPQSRVFNIKG